MRNDDPRDHYYLVRCTRCGLLSHMDRRPFAAAREARKHAKDLRRAGTHETYVVDLNALKIVHRYRFDRLVTPNGGVTDPPF